MSELGFVRLDDRTAKIFSLIYNKAPKIEEEREAKNKRGVTRRQIYDSNIASRETVKSIISDLETEGLILGVPKKWGRYEYFSWDKKETHSFYQLLINMKLI